MMLTGFLSVQILFALFSHEILRRHGYAGRFIFGRETSVATYALVFPGVALSVVGNSVFTGGWSMPVWLKSSRPATGRLPWLRCPSSSPWSGSCRRLTSATSVMPR